ncbi:MarR family winged helix-turn-helix transcriptional regulator [uncultured Clostridium sp.]|uniref:MarR family winged helix-turn-helix transcriptional regulator n=1 Tax=uncultured Clostridium sp. TaxID=59620 RepID=UPI00261C4188|nr:MarR family transcriptional regulator [uncultured Clostridium sp.]
MEDYSDLQLDKQLCFRLYAASREVIKRYKPLLDEHNLTYTQYITMMVMWEAKKMTVKKIGEKLRLDSGTLTPLLKKLEAMEVIRKYRDPKDDRSVIVELTDKGLDLRDAVKDVPKKIMCTVGTDIEDLINLRESLDKLLNSM